MSRVLNGIGYALTIFGSLQAGGVFELLPPRVTMVLLVTGASLSAFNERMQGGLSKKERF